MCLSDLGFFDSTDASDTSPDSGFCPGPTRTVYGTPVMISVSGLPDSSDVCEGLRSASLAAAAAYDAGDTPRSDAAPLFEVDRYKCDRHRVRCRGDPLLRLPRRESSDPPLVLRSPLYPVIAD